MALTDSNKKKNYTNVTNENTKVAQAKIIKFPTKKLKMSF